jgi:hypothetical protein
MPYPLFNGGLPGDGGLQGVWDGGQELQNYIANATYINGNLKQTILSGYITGELGFSIAGGPNAQTQVTLCLTAAFIASFLVFSIFSIVK